jgi:hypothetical protein
MSMWLPQDGMQHIEMIVFAKLLDLVEERTEGLWVFSPGHIAID